MNSDEIWLLQLFSGTVGAFVAALIGGGVALLVVNLANRHQSGIAAKQLKHQEEVAAAQLQHQWDVSNAQARAASKTRENQIVADLIVAGYDLLDAVYISNEALEEVRRRMSASVIAWNFEASHPALFAVLREWPHWMLNLAKLARDHPTSIQRAEANAEVRWKVGQFIRSLEAWPTATEDERLAILGGDLKLPGPATVVIPADPIPWDQRSAADQYASRFATEPDA